MKIIAWIFALIVASLAQNLEINNKCSYTLGKAVFVCSGLQNVANNIDTFLTPHTRMLIIKNSDEIYFSAYHHNVTNYEFLLNYNIIDNNLLKITECAFYGLPNLQYMKITGNYLPHLKNNSFCGLKKLEVLNLSQNNMTRLDEHVFAGLQALLNLDLATNNIKKISSNVFLDLIHLKILHLEHNNIQDLERHSFVGLMQLEILDLRFNEIQIVRADDFNMLHELRTLYVSFNRISKFTGDLKLNKLSFLFIDHNKLTKVEESTLKYLINIQAIDLSNNDLSNLTEKVFFLPSLKHLNLKNNNINSDFSDLQKNVSIIM